MNTYTKLMLTIATLCALSATAYVLTLPSEDELIRGKEASKPLRTLAPHEYVDEMEALGTVDTKILTVYFDVPKDVKKQTVTGAAFKVSFFDTYGTDLGYIKYSHYVDPKQSDESLTTAEFPVGHAPKTWTGKSKDVKVELITVQIDELDFVK